jgi:hypothetical protein
MAPPTADVVGQSSLRREPSRNFAQRNAGMRRGKSLEKGASRVTPRRSVASGPFSSIRTEACKPPQTLDWGAFVRAQIAAREDEPNPIGFSLPDGTKGRVWLGSDRDHSKNIGDDRLWRVNTEELLRQKEPPQSTLLAANGRDATQTHHCRWSQ